jgi:hypothetical protein
MSLIIRTLADLQAEAETAERARAAEAARRYLAETDWMVIRAAETGKPVPEDVATARAEARRKLGGF